MNTAHEAGRAAAAEWIADHAWMSRASLIRLLHEGVREPQGPIMLRVEGARDTAEYLGCTEADLPEALARFDAGWIERLREEITVRKARPVLRIVR